MAKHKTARAARTFPAPASKNAPKQVDKKNHVEEKKIDLHAKPDEDKDFLHEINKTSGNLYNGMILASAADSDNIAIFDPTNRHLPFQYKEKKLKCAPNTLCTTFEYGGVIMAGHATKTQIICWEYDNQDKMLAFMTKELVSCMKTFSKGAYCIAGTRNGNIHGWNTETGHMIIDQSAHFEEITHLALSNDDSLVATGCHGGTVKLWVISDLLTASANNVSTTGGQSADTQAQELVNYKGHTETITGLYINKFTTKLYTSSLDNTCIIWDLFTGMELKKFNCQSPIVSMAVEGMETIVYLGCKNKNVYCMEVKAFDEQNQVQKKAKRTLIGHNNNITCIALSKNDTRLVVGTEDGVLYIWKIDDPSLDPALTTLEVHKDKGEITNILPILKPNSLFGLNTQTNTVLKVPFLKPFTEHNSFNKAVSYPKEGVKQEIIIPNESLDLSSVIHNQHSKRYLVKPDEAFDDHLLFNLSVRPAKSIQTSSRPTAVAHKSNALSSSTALGRALSRQAKPQASASDDVMMSHDEKEREIATLKTKIRDLERLKLGYAVKVKELLMKTHSSRFNKK